jgi:hypothetical protein
MNRKTKLYSRNLRLARSTFDVGKQQILRKTLEDLSAMHLDIGSGDLTLLNNHWYVTHTGLLRMAKRKRCTGIEVEAVANLCDSAIGRYVFRATVYSSKVCRGFVGYGDADPSNVSSLVRGAEMRVAETRAVNRALRKAYGIGICSVEEIGTVPTSGEKIPPPNVNSKGNGNGSGPKSSRPPLPDHSPTQA